MTGIRPMIKLGVMKTWFLSDFAPSRHEVELIYSSGHSLPHSRSETLFVGSMLQYLKIAIITGRITARSSEAHCPLAAHGFYTRTWSILRSTARSQFGVMFAVVASRSK